MTFDELIAQGIREILAEELDEQWPTVEKPHRFSISYRIKRAIIINFRVEKIPLFIKRRTKRMSLLSKRKPK